MPKPITPEEAETFFRFFYIATSGAKFYQTGGDGSWEDLDSMFREMRNEFFEGQLAYERNSRKELRISSAASLNTGLITTTAYGNWVREGKHRVPQGEPHAETNHA